MLGKILTALTGKDDVERAAAKGDASLVTLLRTRPLHFPRRPQRSLEASGCTQDQLVEFIESEAKAEAEADGFEPWILETEGKRRLLAFSGEKQMQQFTKTICTELNQIFAIGYAEVLLADVLAHVEADSLELNFGSEPSWSIELEKLGTAG